MTLAAFFTSLTAAERDFIAGLDYGAERAKHREALDQVLERGGRVDFSRRGVWHPYEVIELGAHWLQPGHAREYAACVALVVVNVRAGGDRTREVGEFLEARREALASLPPELRAVVDALSSP
jgi:hypothetical protein